MSLFKLHFWRELRKKPSQSRKGHFSEKIIAMNNDTKIPELAKYKKKMGSICDRLYSVAFVEAWMKSKFPTGATDGIKNTL